MGRTSGAKRSLDKMRLIYSHVVDNTTRFDYHYHVLTHTNRHGLFNTERFENDSPSGANENLISFLDVGDSIVFINILQDGDITYVR